MKNILRVAVATAFLLGIFVLSESAQAHQPRITRNRTTVVENPEISKAYYGKLVGEPDVYRIDATAPFDLYVNVLVPDVEGQKKEVSADIYKDGVHLAGIGGPAAAWEKFYEPFGADTYWRGPEYKARASAGRYDIRVASPANDSKYALAIGEIESFSFKEQVNALATIPKLKKDFFGRSPATFIFSPIGIGYLFITLLFGAVVGFIYRALLRRFAKTPARRRVKNIGTMDRVLRFGIGIALLAAALFGSWNPLLLIFAGFSFFEAAFSWCAYYAAIGKNTCPL